MIKMIISLFVFLLYISPFEFQERYPSAKTRPGLSQATKINLFAGIVNFAIVAI